MQRATIAHVIWLGLWAMLGLMSAFAARGADQPHGPTIAAFGDSLTAGFGLPEADSFPAQLQAALRTHGHADVEVLNLGVSGDTTAAALARLDWSIPEDAACVIVEIGPNDALRGLPAEQAAKNLDAILTSLAKRQIPVLVAGFKGPSNWGPGYARTFESMYGDLAAKHGAAIYPFFLDGVAFDPKLNQADGLHPNKAGVAVIVERMLPAVKALIGQAH